MPASSLEQTMAYQQGPPGQPQRWFRRTPPLWVVVIGLPVVLLATGGYALAVAKGAGSPSSATSPSPSPSTLTVSGKVTVIGDRPAISTVDEITCTTGGGFTDIQEGAQVVVTDAAGRTIALGRLTYGSWERREGCIFLFDVPDVPAGQRFYGVEVSHRGRLQYTAEQLADRLVLTLGD